jgi:hypothetical protein
MIEPALEEGLLCVSPKRWHLPTSLHGAKTQNNSSIRMKADDEFEEAVTVISYHAVSDVVDDAGDEGRASGLCCYGTRILCREVNRLRGESGGQVIPLDRWFGAD